jgi:hypothetical protein
MCGEQCEMRIRAVVSSCLNHNHEQTLQRRMPPRTGLLAAVLASLQPLLTLEEEAAISSPACLYSHAYKQTT